MERRSGTRLERESMGEVEVPAMPSTTRLPGVPSGARVSERWQCKYYHPSVQGIRCGTRGDKR